MGGPCRLIFSEVEEVVRRVVDVVNFGAKEFQDAVEIALKKIFGVGMIRRDGLGKINYSYPFLVVDDEVEFIEIAVDHASRGEMGTNFDTVLENIIGISESKSV